MSPLRNGFSSKSLVQEVCAMICGAIKLKRIEVGATSPAKTFGIFPPEELQLFFTGSDVKQVDCFASPDAG